MKSNLFRELICALMCALVLLQSVQAAAPGWWTTQGVIAPNKAPDDHAALNQGQLKNFVRAAIYELHAKLPGGAGSVLNNLLQTWRTQKLGADDHAVVTLGQLKAVAKPVYEALQAAGASLSMPWTEATTDDDDHAVANLGQAKRVFAFVVPDLVTLGMRDSDGDGFSDALEVAMGTDAFSAASRPGGTGDLAWLLGNGFGSFGRSSGGGAARGSLPPYQDPFPEPWPNFDAAGSSEPDPTRDSDDDGVPDLQDAVPYDPALKFAKTGVPRYAVLDLGLMHGQGYSGYECFIGMTDNGAVAWHVGESYGTAGEITKVWRPDHPQVVSVESGIAKASPATGWSGTLYGIGDDGKLLGWSGGRMNDKPFLLKTGPFTLDPDAGGPGSWLPEVMVDEGDFQAMHLNGDDVGGSINDWRANEAEMDRRWSWGGWSSFYSLGGHTALGGKIVGTVFNGVYDASKDDADWPDFSSERDWVSFYQVGGGVALEDSARVYDFPDLPEPVPPEYDEDGHVTNYPEYGTRESLGAGTLNYRYSGAASRSGVIRTTRAQRLQLYKFSTGGGWVYDADIDPLVGLVLDEDVYETRLQLTSGQRFVLDAGDLLLADPLDEVPQFSCISAATKPWVGGQTIDRTCWWKNKAFLAIPKVDGSAYERHFIYADEADYKADIPLLSVTAIDQAGHALVNGFVANSSEWDQHALWADGVAHRFKDIVGSYDEYGYWSWRYYDMSAEGMIAASAEVVDANGEYERHMLVLVPITTHAILADGSIAPVSGGVQASLPAPVFCDAVEGNGTPVGDAFCELRNPRLLADGSLVGDVYLRGKLASRACDFVSGAKGSITTAQLWVNGADTPQASFDVAANKQAGGTRARPYPYEGSFETTVQGVPLTPGMNTFKITAQDTMYALPGYSTWCATVTVDDPSGGDGSGAGGSAYGSLGLTVALPAPALSSNAADTVQAALVLSGQTTAMSLTETADASGVFTGTAGGQPVRLLLVSGGPPSATSRDEMTAHLLLGTPGGARTWVVGLIETGAATGVFQGGWSSSGGAGGGTSTGGGASSSSTTSTGGSTGGGAGGNNNANNNANGGANNGGANNNNAPAALPPVVQADSVAQFLGKSNGGEFHPYVLGVGVPAAMAGQSFMAFDEETFKLMRDAESGLMMLEDPQNPGKPFCPSFAPHDGPPPSEDEIEHAKRLEDMKKESFEKGFACGMGYGGLDMVTSTGKLVAGAAKFGGRALMQVGLTFKWAGELITGQNTVQTQRMMIEIDDQQREVVGQGLQLAKFLNEIITAPQTMLPKLGYAMLTGDQHLMKTALYGSESHQMMFSIVSEALVKTKEEWETGTPGQKGYITGRISFEVLTFLAPFAKAKMLAKVSQLQVLQYLKNTKIFKVGARMVLTAKELLLGATKMCFEPGTKIKTHDDERILIEDVREDVRVWSRDPFTGVEGLRRVAHVTTTHPTELYRLTYEVRGPPESSADIPVRSGISETLGVTAPHPFWVCNNETPGFIEAEDLRVGDVLLISGGHEAVVTGNVLERAPPGETFTTYNFEVEGFHTYFVGDAGVWVHNSARGECEKLEAIYRYLRKNRLANGVNETPYETFGQMLMTLKASANPGHQALFQAAFDSSKGIFNGRALRFALKAINDEMFALVANGDLPLSALPKIKDFKNLFPGLGTWGKPSPTDMHRHHLLEGRYFDRVVPHMSPQGRLLTPTAGDIPAYIVEQINHTGAGGIAPELTRAIGADIDPRIIYREHVNVYGRLGHDKLLDVFEQWWTLHGLPR